MLKSNIFINKIKNILNYNKHIVNNPTLLENLNEFKNIIIFIPHPDDEIIGCGGLILKALQENINIKLIYDKIKDKKRKTEAINLNNYLKTDFIISNNKIDFSETIKNKNKLLVCLPNLIDNHLDHFNLIKSFHQWLIKNKNKKLKILLYEVWTPHLPNYILNITNLINEKIKLLNFYKSQLINKNYIQAIQGLNCYRSLFLKNNSEKTQYAESYVILSIQEFDKLFLFYK